MPIFWYIIIAIAIAIIGGAIGGFIGIGVAVRRIEPMFLEFNEQIDGQDKRIGTLEHERKELRIKYRALMSIYHELVRWSGSVVGIFERLGATYPEPPHRATEVD